ncbi:MAG: succinylglutamate desuccinylase/aspartoacylase family protein, partial [Planctomycetota bacterium]
IFQEIVCRCDYGIDLHTASARKTNYPHIRGDLNHDSIENIAMAFGSEIVLNQAGPEGALRREALAAGCPTIVLEAGEVLKVEPGIVRSVVRGIRNVLRRLEMLDGPLERPRYQLVIENSRWLRANKGGFMQFHVAPGDLIEHGQPIVTTFDLLGKIKETQESPFDAVAIGMTTLPAVSPGEPICHLGMLPRGTDLSRLRMSRQEPDGLEEQIVDQLATNLVVVDRDDP